MNRSLTLPGQVKWGFETNSVCPILEAGGSNVFADKHPETRSALAHWYRIVSQNEFNCFADLRIHFPSADQVGKLTVFNIGGNKVRLIAAVHYNRRKIYIRAVLSHVEYDQDKLKE